MIYAYPALDVNYSNATQHNTTQHKDENSQDIFFRKLSLFLSSSINKQKILVVIYMITTTYRNRKKRLFIVYHAYNISTSNNYDGGEQT